MRRAEAYGWRWRFASYFLEKSRCNLKDVKRNDKGYPRKSVYSNIRELQRCLFPMLPVIVAPRPEIIDYFIDSNYYRPSTPQAL